MLHLLSGTVTGLLFLLLAASDIASLTIAACNMGLVYLQMSTSLMVKILNWMCYDGVRT